MHGGWAKSGAIKQANSSPKAGGKLRDSVMDHSALAVLDGYTLTERFYASNTANGWFGWAPHTYPMPIAEPPSSPSRRTLRTSVWVNSTYFAEGLPYMLIRYMASVYFTDIGMREAYLGFLNFLGIPWNLKFLWAPLVDYWGTKRRWMLLLSGSIAFGVALIALGSTRELSTQWLNPGQSAMIVMFLCIGLAFISATHDIAIDGFYMTALSGTSEQALYTGDRVLAYRVAIIYVKSILVAAAALIGWTGSWLAAAATMALLCGFHAWYLPRPEGRNLHHKIERKPISHLLRHFGRTFCAYIDQPRVVLMLLFVIGYKLGDEILFSMNTPFLLRELGMNKTQLAGVAGMLGTIGSIGGSLGSAAWIARVGLKRAIWPLTLLMNLNILAYVGLAIWKPDPTITSGLTWIAIIHTYEQFAAGLGNAVLMIYLMRTCKPNFKAAHYAIGSALMSLGSTMFGGFGGLVVESYGYVWLYLIGFMATIPAMALIPFIPHLEETK